VYGMIMVMMIRKIVLIVIDSKSEHHSDKETVVTLDDPDGLLGGQSQSMARSTYDTISTLAE